MTSGSEAGAGPREQDDFLAAWRRNPFFVLGLAPTATPLEIERTGQRLLGLLTVGSADAARCDTPFGPLTRDAEAVRDALAALRDPAQRLLHALWADIAPAPSTQAAGTEAPAAAGEDTRTLQPPLHLRLLGWKWGA